MKIYVVFIISILGLFGCSDKCINDFSVTNEEIILYNKVIEDVYSEYDGKLLTIIDSTITNEDWERDDSGSLSETIKENTKNDSLALNFYCKNKTKHPIINNWFNDINKEQIQFTTNKILENIFNKGDGWEEFYQTFTNSAGILTLSRIGVVQDTAIIYVGIQSHYLSGIGNLYYYKRIQGQWVLKEKFMLWIS